MAKSTVYDLKQGCRYRVRRDFTDFYGGHFAAGTILTFQEYNFLPYDGGYTIRFAEQTLYLQEEENVGILKDIWTYLESLDGG